MKTCLLWENGAPGQLEGCEVPVIHYCPAKNKTHTGTVVIFAGGGYVMRAPHESVGYAEYLNAAGFDVFYTDYRIQPYYYPCALLDARRSVRFVRAHAEEYGIDPAKIAVMGSSAGANLCTFLTSDLGAFPQETGDALDAVDSMPNAQILCYPYIFMDDPGLSVGWCNDVLFGEGSKAAAAEAAPEHHICSRTPQTFIFHTAADNVVNVIHSYRYAAELRKREIPVEMHIFPDGGHGLGLCNLPQHDFPAARHDAQWGSLLINWLCYLGF